MLIVMFVTAAIEALIAVFVRGVRVTRAAWPRQRRRAA
jgi:hypothetical protein